jgi:glycosyltransferase involved in cell wall biosynthesis
MNFENGKPLLSILVPAYRYVEGVYRILASLHPWPVDDCEVIIFDDSQDGEVEQAVAHWCTTTGVRVWYQHNRPAHGTAVNWNSLLDAARGEYCLLLHHDEFPLSRYFVGDLISALRTDPGIDVLMLDCVLVARQSGQNRRHLPTWVRAVVVNRFPQYLFRRNVIGPTAALVARRSLYPRFDVRLQWLIDVDMYVRLLRVAEHVRLCPEVKIGSILGRSDSITAHLGSSIPHMAQDERDYLQRLHPTAGFWLGPAPGESVMYGLLRTAEAVCWSFMRVVTCIAGLFFPNPVPRTVVQQALQARPGP